MRRNVIVVVMWMASLCLSSKTTGFEIETHKALSARALTPGISSADMVLKSALGFEFFNGINEVVVGGRSVTQLVQDGAENEDCCLIRPRHHFHNPRLAWDQAGWRPPPLSIQLGESSVIWSQDTNQSIGGKHSWQDARNTYFQALTATTDSERKRLYGETFKSLGHLIHLVQDAAVPSHTRNDTHINYAGIGDPDAFHGWAESTGALNAIATMTPSPFNTSLLNQSSPNASAPVPIARIIDSTDGDIGSLGLTPGLNIGIAEYSSANFLSDDTINSPNFLSPVSSQVEVRAPELDATGTTLRRYVYFRPGFGEQNYPLALASAMLSYVIDPLATPTENGLDNKVFQGYGAKLFPRAIGYSAGLIDYFFRGRMTVNDAFNDTALDIPLATTSIQVLDVVITDETGTESVGSGTARIVLIKGGPATIGGIDPPPAVQDEYPDILVSNPTPISGPTIPSTLSFSFDVLPFPTTQLSCAQCSHANHYLAFLVFQGTLGQESQTAVVVSEGCDTGQMHHRYFTRHQQNVLEGNRAAITGFCGFDPPLQ